MTKRMKTDANIVEMPRHNTATQQDSRRAMQRSAEPSEPNTRCRAPMMNAAADPKERSKTHRKRMTTRVVAREDSPAAEPNGAGTRDESDTTIAQRVGDTSEVGNSADDVSEDSMGQSRKVFEHNETPSTEQQGEPSKLVKHGGATVPNLGDVSGVVEPTSARSRGVEHAGGQIKQLHREGNDGQDIRRDPDLETHGKHFTADKSNHKGGGGEGEGDENDEGEGGGEGWEDEEDEQCEGDGEDDGEDDGDEAEDDNEDDGGDSGDDGGDSEDDGGDTEDAGDNKDDNKDDNAGDKDGGRERDKRGGNRDKGGPEPMEVFYKVKQVATQSQPCGNLSIIATRRKTRGRGGGKRVVRWAKLPKTEGCEYKGNTYRRGDFVNICLETGAEPARICEIRKFGEGEYQILILWAREIERRTLERECEQALSGIVSERRDQKFLIVTNHADVVKWDTFDSQPNDVQRPVVCDFVLDVFCKDKIMSIQDPHLVELLKQANIGPRDEPS